MIRFLAYTLSLAFYHRQVCSHAGRKCQTFQELAKRLACWFVALSPNTHLAGLLPPDLSCSARSC